MKGSKEDWSQESQPLIKSREPKGKEISSTVCPLCQRTVTTVDGRTVTHSCVSLKKYPKKI